LLLKFLNGNKRHAEEFAGLPLRFSHGDGPVPSPKPQYRVAYFVSHPIQYQAPMLRYLSDVSDIDLTVFFLSNLSVKEYFDPGFRVPVCWDISLLDGYKHTFLPTLGRSDRLSTMQPWVVGIRRILQSGRFDAVWVHGYAHQAIVRTIFTAKLLGLPVLLRGESNLLMRPRSVLRRSFGPPILRQLLRCIDGFLAIGSKNAEFYRKHQIPEEQISLMPYAVDNVFFRSGAAKAAPLRESLRAELKLAPKRPVILFSSKLESRKCPEDVLNAYRLLSPDGLREPLPYLLFVGDGEERTRLEAVANGLNWSSIRFLGFQNQRALPAFYDLADVFVLPSAYESWGLAVNEAMNAAKPIIVSNQVCAAADLVQDGVNGFVVPVGDTGSLAQRLRTVVGDPLVARHMGEESYRRISSWDFEADARGLLNRLRAVVGR
jgi:glycosyltransferase involved in cell wall biosynthesis